MQTLFDPASVQELQRRLQNVTPASPRQWGKMTPAQMLAHCALSMQWALGELVPDTLPIPVRLLGKLIKPMVVRGSAPLRKNSPTAKSLIITTDPDLTTERARLSQLIEKFSTGGPAACTQAPHSFFGRLTPQEWAILLYKHLDHHFRQFSA